MLAKAQKFLIFDPNSVTMPAQPLILQVLSFPTGAIHNFSTNQTQNGRGEGGIHSVSEQTVKID